MSELLDIARQADKIWKPTVKGEALEGTVVKIRNVHFGRVLVVRGFTCGPDDSRNHDRETDWLVNVGNDSTLCTKIDDAGVCEGVGMAIVFNGTGTSKSGRQFKSWSVAIDNPKPSPPGGINGRVPVADDNNPF